MSIQVSHKNLTLLPKLVKHFVLGEKEADFLQIPNSISAIEEIISAKSSFDQNKREVLVSELEKQYAFIPSKERESNQVWKNIQSLKNKDSYTITTGQQIHIFLGPMYVPHKILSTIALCEELKKSHPKYNYIPVFWMATEDHDFEEISSVKIWNKEFFWDEEHGGATGEINPIKINEIVKEIKNTFTLKSNELEVLDIFENIYATSSTLAEATCKLVHHFWGDKGIVCIDANKKIFKEIFKIIIAEEVSNSLAFKAVKNQSEKIKLHGFETQINPRETSLFMFNNNKRERLDKMNDTLFRIEPSGKEFSKEEILTLIEENPEVFSPNVATRPLFQETILPNLAYIGGAGELSYWFQLKDLFQKAKIHFPILRLRKMVVYINEITLKNWEELGFELEELFVSQNNFEEIVAHKIGVSAQKNMIERELDELVQRICNLSYEIDPKSVKDIKSEGKVWKKNINEHFNRLQEKTLEYNELKLKKANKIRKSVFPDNIFQERSLSFLEYMFKQMLIVDNPSVNYVDNQNIEIHT